MSREQLLESEPMEEPATLDALEPEPVTLDALDAEIATTRQMILEKERFETVVVRRRDERAGLLDAAGFGATLTDFAFEEKKVSRILGAEKEHEALSKLLDARRALVGE